MVLQFGEEVEGVEGLHIVEVGVAEGVEDFAVNGGEDGLLARRRAAGRKFFAQLALADFVAEEHLAGALDDAAREAGEAGDFPA